MSNNGIQHDSHVQSKPRDEVKAALDAQPAQPAQPGALSFWDTLATSGAFLADGAKDSIRLADGTRIALSVLTDGSPADVLAKLGKSERAKVSRRCVLANKDGIPQTRVATGKALADHLQTRWQAAGIIAKS